MTVIVEKDIEFTARDGVVLRADIFRPAAPGRYPVLLLRVPYGKHQFLVTHLALDPVRAAERGYVVVHQDTRGRGASGGTFRPFVDELADGYDTVEWAASLPCSNGSVGAYGVSYAGSAALQAAASGAPSLRAIAAAQAPSDHHALLWRGGAFQLGFFLFWTSFFLGLPPLIGDRRQAPGGMAEIERLLAAVDDFEATARRMPQPDRLVGELIERYLPYFAEAPEHPEADAFHAERSVSARYAGMRVPALITAGWNDVMLGEDLRTFEGLRAGGANPDARYGTRLVVGPWTHGGGLLTGAAGDLDFGVRGSGLSIDLADDLTSHHLRWFDRRLGTAGQGDEESPVRIFVMGENRWRDEDAWPLRRARLEKWYLGSPTTLGRRPPEAAAGPRTYAYDPDDPCPTRGGAVMLPPAYARGPVDQSPLLDRDDVLLYESAQLGEPTEVTGTPRAALFVATTAVDTDWVVKLCDVWPDGRVLNVCDGILRARFRDGDRSRPRFVPTGETVELGIDLGATSHVFLAGHRIALMVTSSDFPRYDRNPNTGEDGLSGRRTAIALQMVFADPQRPSHVRLPVVPRRA